jgi:hypothetical protein
MGNMGDKPQAVCARGICAVTFLLARPAAFAGERWLHLEWVLDAGLGAQLGTSEPIGNCCKLLGRAGHVDCVY